MLHVKLNTDSITIADCWTKLKETFNLKDLDSPYATDKWIDLVFKMADNICTESAAGVSLTNKITLSIAIRLKAEFFLRNILVNNSIDIMCDAYQTRIWAKRAHSLLSDDEKLVISEVLLITPESIHVNAFMYEPLIDIPNYQLIELYQNCKLLGAKC